MEVYRTEDGLVSKYVHDDGSETAIKTVSSCGNIFNKATGKIEPVGVDRNKFSVFVSTSVGCPVGCKFCYLTTKKYPYYKLKPKQIYDNVQEALSAEVKFKPEIRKKYMKLSWMGMGDAFLLDPSVLRNLTRDIITWAIRDTGVVWGLDGVDIATTMPASKPGWPHQLSLLNDDIDDFRRNPKSMDRSPVRIFYSLHKGYGRKDLIPMARHKSPAEDLKELAQFRHWYGIDVIIHHMFLNKINDTRSMLEEIRNYQRYIIPNTEVRILRFNECENSPYKESKDFDKLVKLYADNLPKVKYQISAGSEIKAACGQFLCLTNAEK